MNPNWTFYASLAETNIAVAKLDWKVNAETMQARRFLLTAIEDLQCAIESIDEDFDPEEERKLIEEMEREEEKEAHDARAARRHHPGHPAPPEA